MSGSNRRGINVQGDWIASYSCSLGLSTQYKGQQNQLSIGVELVLHRP